MTVATPISAVALAEAWIFTKLSTDTQLATLVGNRIFAGVAPEGQQYPLIAYQGITGVDLTAPAFRRIFTTFLYDVHCADRVQSLVGLDAIAARVDACLHGQQAYQFDSGAYEVACQRTNLIPLASQVAGVPTRELVASYLVIIQEAGDV